MVPVTSDGRLQASKDDSEFFASNDVRVRSRRFEIHLEVNWISRQSTYMWVPDTLYRTVPRLLVTIESNVEPEKPSCTAGDPGDRHQNNRGPGLCESEQEIMSRQ